MAQHFARAIQELYGLGVIDYYLHTPRGETEPVMSNWPEGQPSRGSEPGDVPAWADAEPIIAARAAEMAAPSVDEVVNAHAIVLKVGTVNALRTDGGDPFPVTEAALAIIRAQYTDRINELSAQTLIGETLTADEVAEVTRIKAGFAFFKEVDTAAQTIIAAGDPADPIETDTRWPDPPTP
jgi:hypothetical protein